MASLLKQYIETINKVIKELKEYYALHVYSSELNTDIPYKEIQFIVNDQHLLETLLLEIRGKTISYSSYIRKKNKEREIQLMSDIEHLEKEYDKNTKTITDKKRN